MIFSHSYSTSEISTKSYYFKIPFGKHKGKYIDLKNINTILSLIKTYFSLFNIEEIPVYCEYDDKKMGYEDGMYKIGDIVLDVEVNIRYYKSGSGFPNKNIPFSKIKKLIKTNEIKEDISGRK